MYGKHHCNNLKRQHKEEE